MEQNLQHICNEMDHKAYGFMDFQRAYYTNRVDDQHLTEHTTQPFWQSMSLSKRRLASKGLTMDVQITRDRFGRMIKDERMCMRRDGHHLVGNKAMNVKALRTFYKDGKKLSAFKNKEICNVSLLKTEVMGNRAVCPDCGHINTVQSFIDGCDACGSKFTVQDFQTKVSGFSLEEDIGSKVKSTIMHNILMQALVLFGGIVLGALLLILVAFGSYTGGGALMDMVLTVLIVFETFPIAFKSLIILGVIYLIGAICLFLIYRKRILGEEIVKQVLPAFSAGDFYQNLEYKLRNIHLADSAKEVNVFARCPLDSAVRDYKDVVECDMNRLKFRSIQKDSDGYRVKISAKMRLTKYRGKRIAIKYENLDLQLFGRPDVVNKPVAALREYKCPGCGSSINILEGGRCNYCGNTYDYSAFGWVIESYENRRQSIPVHKVLPYVMTGLFVILLGLPILFPMGLSEGTFFEVRHKGVELLNRFEDERPDYNKPDELYAGVVCTESIDWFVLEMWTYTAEDAKSVVDEYKEYLISVGMQPYEDLGNGYVMVYDFANKIADPMESEDVYSYYRIVVMYEGHQIRLQADAVENPGDDLEDVVEDMEDNFKYDTIG